MLTNKEKQLLTENKRNKEYFSGDFLTSYRGIPVPLKYQLKDIHKSDNVLKKAVLRYASSTSGENASVEVENEDLNALLSQWQEDTDLFNKVTNIARYQSLFGGAVVKLVFTHQKDSDGAVSVTSPEEALAGITLAVVGMDQAVVRYDDFNNVDSIVILMGNDAEVFYKDRVERHTSTDRVNYKLVSTEPNPIAPLPLAFFIPNVELGDLSASDVKDIIPLQESLNAALTTQYITISEQGFPIFIAKGVEPELDQNGNEVPLQVGAGMVLTLDGESSLERLEAAAVAPINDTIKAIYERLAEATYTLSMLSGNAPSGQALKQLSRDFDAAVKEKQGKLAAFLKRLLRSVLALVDLLTGQTSEPGPVEAYVSGFDPVAEDLKQEALIALYKEGLLSKQTVLDNLPYVKDTASELERLSQEVASSPLTPALFGD